MLKLGWKAGTEQYAPEELLDYAIAAEDAGFDSINASDHFHPWAEHTVKKTTCISANPCPACDGSDKRNPNPPRKDLR